MTRPPGARERYLEIAARLFSETGFHGVSLAALAEEAGVTKQALLHHFKTKERLYAEVLARLSERLLSEIDQIEAANAADRLVAFFTRHAEDALKRPEVARLVVRALLDSDPKARVWPLQPYLDKLVALALETPRWRGAAAEEALAGAYQVIGAIQYVSISSTTLAGMYGEDAHRRLADRFLADVRVAAKAFVAAR